MDSIRLKERTMRVKVTAEWVENRCIIKIQSKGKEILRKEFLVDFNPIWMSDLQLRYFENAFLKQTLGIEGE